MAWCIMTTPTSNREFSRKDAAFAAACVKADIAPSVRQASKYRRARGRAYAASKRPAGWDKV